ncbi:MAG: glycosyltransferase family 4 protein [Ignavibacteriales bacterium]|nr:glycosyltransferase family 4 protein [Ignavibacteriales bacterium]
MLRLAVFTNDPLGSYFAKGEVKARYFNPENLFGEIHVITPAEQDVDAAKAQELVGDARLTVHPLGRPSALKLPALLDRANRLVKSLKPDLIRGHGVHLGGLQAVWSARRNKVPVVISVHSNPDEDFVSWLKQGRIRLTSGSVQQYIWYKLFRRYILHNADHVICAYRFAERYARRHGASPTTVIYNRIDTDRFKPLAARSKRKRPVVLSVNQQIEVKNPEPLIRAVKNLDVDLVLIGDGVLHGRMIEIVDSLGIAGKVTLIKAVPHAKIHEHYQQADIFANPMQCGGVSMGTLEAMSTGLPVVHARPLWEEKPEVLDDLAIVVDACEEGFSAGLKRLLDDPSLAQELGRQGRRRLREMDGKMMEQRERDLYSSLLG